MNLRAEFEGVEGEVEVVGWPRPFGNCMRSNILLKGGTWVSVVGREETVRSTIAGIRKGDFVRARCKVHAGEDYRGRPRRELWVREIETVDARTVKISLPENAYRKVEALSERLGIPPKDYVRLAVMEKLETAAG
ncbi:hypothetical protein KKA03_04175 [archaeon]|nr:hypothetical protein [archaeon]